MVVSRRILNFILVNKYLCFGTSFIYKLQGLSPNAPCLKINIVGKTLIIEGLNSFGLHNCFCSNFRVNYWAGLGQANTCTIKIDPQLWIIYVAAKFYRGAVWEYNMGLDPCLGKSLYELIKGPFGNPISSVIWAWTHFHTS